MKKNLVNLSHVGNEIHLWYSMEDGTVQHEIDYDFSPYFWIKDKNGTHTALDGSKVRKIFFNNLDELTAGRMTFKNSSYEADVDYITRYIIDKNAYKYNTEILPVRTWFLDIEVLMKGRFPSPETASNEITSITIYDSLKRKYITWAWHKKEYLNRSKWLEQGVIVFDNEMDMLRAFLRSLKKYLPQILSGWNIEGFDMPYMVKRLENKQVGLSNELSPVNRVGLRKNDFGKTYIIEGITILDDLNLYKKFEPKRRESYTLDYISKRDLNSGKVEYEGNLDELWENNFAKFIEYTQIDVKRVVQLDDMYQYIDLAREETVQSNSLLRNVFFNSMMTDSLFLTKIRERGMVAPNKVSLAKGEKFEGAWISDPIPGIHEWVFTLDLTSLYPSIIRTCNMSFETLIDKNLDFNKEKVYRTSNDQYFSTDRRGIVAGILDELFEKRKKYKNMSKDFERSGDEHNRKIYDVKQKCMKIILNSIYGYLGMPGSRFFDKRIAEGVTVTGKTLLQQAWKYVENKYDDLRVIYGDTDSLAISVKNVDLQNKESVIELATNVMDDVNSWLKTDFAPTECNIQDPSKCYFEFKFEKVCQIAFWVAKKKYVLDKIWEEGFDRDHVMSITGIETVRSDTPRATREFMKHLLTLILQKKTKAEIDRYVISFRKEIQNKDILEYAIPTGVNGIDKYSEKVIGNIQSEDELSSKGAPIHVKAALNYNYEYAKKEPNKFRKINNSDKIKWLPVVTTPQLPYSLMAFKDDNYDFMKEYKVDWNRLLERIIDKKVDILYAPLGWGKPVDKQNSLRRLRQRLS